MCDPCCQTPNLIAQPMKSRSVISSKIPLMVFSIQLRNPKCADAAPACLKSPICHRPIWRFHQTNKPHVPSNRSLLWAESTELLWGLKVLQRRQRNWWPRGPPSSSSPSKEDAKWQQKTFNEARMIKEALREPLSNCRHSTFFLLLVSSSVLFQLRAADGETEGRCCTTGGA